MIENNDIFKTIKSTFSHHTEYECFLYPGLVLKMRLMEKNFVCPQLEFEDKWYISSLGILILLDKKKQVFKLELS